MMTDQNSPKFEELHSYYMRNFSMGHIDADINSKFALISLICYLTFKAKAKRPDVTHYQVIMQLSKTNPLPENFVKGLAIMCEDFGYGCTEFPTFNIKPNEIPQTIQRLLGLYKPF